MIKLGLTGQGVSRSAEQLAGACQSILCSWELLYLWIQSAGTWCICSSLLSIRCLSFQRWCHCNSWDATYDLVRFWCHIQICYIQFAGVWLVCKFAYYVIRHTAIICFRFSMFLYRVCGMFTFWFQIFSFFSNLQQNVFIACVPSTQGTYKLIHALAYYTVGRMPAWGLDGATLNGQLLKFTQ